ncbi:hypothetical protein [Hymenobacter metallicola]|uniref:DUF4440 domain-containing protein n=1 Tax=Hymenobacter metallicola TaxID=2563114 RepID=A0A4Z0PXP7_9BACT|nr:hypothetical protein [Hymenobacter metallicola]TGE22560.1 hypothetical protein E5K02_22760 [Hymenobacter metallicola]
MPFPTPFLLVLALALPALAAPLLLGTPVAQEPSRLCSVEADVQQTLLAYRHARQVGDSVAALTAFTPSAWTVDQAEKPVHSRFVRLAGCRGWCRPGPLLQDYQVSVLSDSTRALAVETYCLSAPVSGTARRHQRRCYTAVSVLTCRQGQWLIASHTLSGQLPN